MRIIKIKERRYYPMIVSEKGTEDPVALEFLDDIWKKFDALPTDKKEVINSYEIANKILELQKKFGLSDAQIGVVSLMIRQLFFGEIDLGGAESKLRSFISTQAGSDPKQARAVVEFIQKEVLTLTLPKPTAEEDSKSTVGKILKLPLLKALSEYERLGDQMLTTEKIKVKGQPEPQRPSLANWIRYYRDELGIGFHDQVSRGRFLFQSENGKRLSNEERERINLVLKSIEEDFPLDIDTEHQAIVFPVRPPATSPQATSHRPLFPPRAVQGTRPVKPYEPQQPSVVSPPPTTMSHQVSTLRPQPSSGGAQGVPSPVIPPAAKPSFLATKLSPQKNVAGETLHFSTGHVLPGEQAHSVPSISPMTEGIPQAAPAKPTPTLTPSFHPKSMHQNRGLTLPRSPYSIRPLRMRSREGGEETENQ